MVSNHYLYLIFKYSSATEMSIKYEARTKKLNFDLPADFHHAMQRDAEEGHRVPGVS